MRHIYQGTFKDQNGAVVGSATTSDGNPGTVTVYLAGTDTLASVYTAAAGGVAVNSVSTDVYGYFYFWVDDATYAFGQLFKIVLTHRDFIARTYDNITIVQATTSIINGLIDIKISEISTPEESSISTISDADSDTRVTTEYTADEDTIRFYTGAGGHQISLSDGSLLPAVDNDVDIGQIAKRFKVAAFVKYFMTSIYYATFPTNGITTDAVIMTGDSNTITWFYLNAAPPGWKVLATGADTVIGVAGGSASYNVNGGNPDSSATWEFDITLPADASWGDAVGDTTAGMLSVYATGYTWCYNATRTFQSAGTWRPKASVGKLFQLDTA
jgi:hypothetical protein